MAVGLAIQGLLYAHLYSAPQMEPGELHGALSEFPMRLGEWEGSDIKMSSEEQYASDHLKRTYFKGRFGLTLWMVFSDMGEDPQALPRGLPGGAWLYRRPRRADAHRNG